METGFKGGGGFLRVNLREGDGMMKGGGEAFNPLIKINSNNKPSPSTLHITSFRIK